MDGGAAVVRPHPAVDSSFGGVSLTSLGLGAADFAPGGRYYEGRVTDAPADLQVIGPGQAAATNYPDDRSPSARVGGNPTQGYSLQPRPNPAGELMGKVPQNWSVPIRVPAGTPILEVYTNRVARGVASERFYQSDGVCGPAIDILAEFPLNRGFDMTPLYASDELPPWFPLDTIDQDSLVDAEGNSQVKTLVNAYIQADCEALADDLNLVYEMVDLQTRAYVHGDGFINRVDDIRDPSYAWDHSRVHTENTVAELQGLNPTAVWIIRNELGETERIIGVRALGMQPFELDIDRTLHLKHKGSSYTTYGFPQTLRVFKELLVKQAYLDAAQAWGERYALPVRLLKYGLLVRAGDNSGPVATPQMRAAAEAAVAGYDPTTGQTLVVPFHYEYVFVGAEGATAMMVSNEIEQCNKRILAGLGVPSAFLLGDWTNYATARIQYTGLMHRLKTVQENLRRLLIRRIFLPFIQMRGYVDCLGNPIPVDITWRRGHLEDDQSMQDFLAQIAALPGVLSLRTIRETMGFSNEVEEANLNTEAEAVQGRMRRLQMLRQQAPGQVPEMMPPGETPVPADPMAPVPADPPAPDPTMPVYPPVPDTSFQQQVILRRIQQGLERITDKLTQQMGLAQQHLAAYATQQPDPVRFAAEERRVCKILQGLHLQQAAYRSRLAQATAAVPPIAAQPIAGAVLDHDYAPEAATPPPALAPAPSGTMVALMLPADVAAGLALPGGEPAEGLHVTLVYLPDLTDPASLASVLGEVTARTAPLTVTVAAVGRFTGTSPGTDCIWAGVTGDTLPSFRADLVAALTAAGIVPDETHAYTPHVTLAYVPAGTPAPVTDLPPRSVLLTALTAACGPDRQDYPLTGGPA